MECLFYFHSDWAHFCVCYELPCIPDGRIVPLVWNHEVTKICNSSFALIYCTPPLPSLFSKMSKNMIRAFRNTRIAVFTVSYSLSLSTCCKTQYVTKFEVGVSHSCCHFVTNMGASCQQSYFGGHYIQPM